MALLRYESQVRPPLVVDDKHYHNVTEDICRPVEARPTRLWWIGFLFSVAMLIWYSNQPEETIYFIPRVQGPYRGIFFLNLIINFIAPLLILMKRGSKRHYATMTFMCVLLIFGHWLDFFQMVFPGPLTDHATGRTHVPLMLFDFGIALGFVGLIMFITARSLSKWPMIIKHHPFIKESIIHHT